jgi:UrcA family protein
MVRASGPVFDPPRPAGPDAKPAHRAPAIQEVMTMSRMIPIAAATLATATLLATVALPAKAETMSVHVPYGDLDLSSEAGQRALDRRIDRAVVTICGSGAATLSYRPAHRRCVREARASAAPQVVAAIAKSTSEAFASLDTRSTRKR